MGHGRVQLYQRRQSIANWITGGAGSTPTFLYLPTIPSCQYFKADFYLLNGPAAADIVVSAEVSMQYFKGAAWNGANWSGGSWTTFAALDCMFMFDNTTHTYFSKGDEINPENMFKTFMEAIPDVTKPGGSLIMSNTHAATPVVGETDLRVAVGFQLATGIVDGLELGLNVKVMLEA